MANKSIPELDKLFFEIGTYRKSDELKGLFEFVKRFPHVAPYNAMLIHIQKPGSRYVASAEEWKYRYNRNIKPGARPLVILRPFGPVAFVFELADTYGEEPFPQELINPFHVEGKVPNKIFNKLIGNMLCDGISYSKVDYGTDSAGYIQINNNENIQRLKNKNKEMWVKILYNMCVNKNHDDETKFATTVHELGHLYCGHLGTPNEKWWSDRYYLGLSEREFEAESISWLICERMRIANPSAAYLSGYLNENDEIPNISIDIILKSVGIIESMLNGIKEPRKELIVSPRH